MELRERFRDEFRKMGFLGRVEEQHLSSNSGKLHFSLPVKLHFPDAVERARGTGGAACFPSGDAAGCGAEKPAEGETRREGGGDESKPPPGALPELRSIE